MTTIRIQSDSEELDLTRHPGVVILVRWGWTLEWDREGEIRRVPKAYLLDAARQIENRLNAPRRYHATMPPITIPWSAVNPRAYESPSQASLRRSLHRMQQDPSRATPSD